MFQGLGPKNTMTFRKSTVTPEVQIVDLAGSERLKPYEQGSQGDKQLMNQVLVLITHIGIMT